MRVPGSGARHGRRRQAGRQGREAVQEGQQAGRPPRERGPSRRARRPRTSERRSLKERSPPGRRRDGNARIAVKEQAGSRSNELEQGPSSGRVSRKSRNDSGSRSNSSNGRRVVVDRIELEGEGAVRRLCGRRSRAHFRRARRPVDVPVVKVDEIDFEVDDLRAQVAVMARGARHRAAQRRRRRRPGQGRAEDRGRRGAGAPQGAARQRDRILERVLTTLDRNPELLESVGKAVGGRRRRRQANARGDRRGGRGRRRGRRGRGAGRRPGSRAGGRPDRPRRRARASARSARAPARPSAASAKARARRRCQGKAAQGGRAGRARTGVGQGGVRAGRGASVAQGGGQ